MTSANPMAKCQARNRQGKRCGEWPLRGQNVCHLHGGKAPQALRKADERMRDLVHPALSSLARQIDANEFAAVKYVLDWAGFKPTEKVQADAEVTVTVTYADVMSDAARRAYELAPPNGHG